MAEPSRPPSEGPGKAPGGRSRAPGSRLPGVASPDSLQDPRADARFEQLRPMAGPRAAQALEALVREAPDAQLCRINVYDFAARAGLSEAEALDLFVHASRLGLFDLSWNLLCPGCGGVLDAATSLRHLDKETYYCALCAGGYAPTLDEMVEVSFTVNPGVRRIAAHAPDDLPFWEYQRQVFWSSGIHLPEGEAFEAVKADVILEAEEIPAGGRCILNVQLPEAFVILFDAVTHTAFFLDCKGEATRERRELTVVFSESHPPTGTRELPPGPLRLTLENRTGRRVLPGLYLANDSLHHLLGHRKRFLTARDLLSTQTFRDHFRAETLDLNQRLRITSLTFLFTDLKGSTELYERVGDLAAYDLVRDHFRALNEAVGAEGGAVVKTIGDAVMATFPSPERGLRAALRMREAIADLNAARGAEDLLVKIGLHEGPCLAVTLNERLDYFGQTVNVAARVQGLAVDRAIYATEPVVGHPGAADLLWDRGLHPAPRRAALKGVREEMTVFEIP